MSGTQVAADWRGGLRLWWSFTWRLAAALLLASSVMVLAGYLLVSAGMSGKTYIRLSSPLGTLLFFVLQIDSFRRLAGAYDIRIPGGPSHEQDHRHRR
ncbi:MAG TPA: hypothetical protein DCZ01_01595 [Elusimicrobia bacterium]|nr:MAG: hypothetical protein A2X37_07245 [Elusimicrobia bacterium GWA2_66_18]OGR76704.1 MAG: hypothetical protein A2X40_02115 [Elusimicrobia bacterium GWC2_65_9]HAZ07224.1 hypothetical protein [Elusimicrobiota bacterium]